METELYNHQSPVTPSDTVDQYPSGIVQGAVPALFDALYIGGAGNVVVVRQDGTAVTFTAPPVGSILPVRGRRVNSTNTTATAMVALRRI